MSHTPPAFIISGLSGGAGKTLASLGIVRAFARLGLKVRACKKGPDYIDAAWLARASGSPQCTLDPYFTPGRKLRTLYEKAAQGYDLAVIEGNRGLFDGMDVSGSCSTAEVARQLGMPVVIVLDCTKMTRTSAAIIKGCLTFEQGLTIGGVILNRTGNPRHRAIVRQSIEELCGIPVLGAFPRKKEALMAERHMGLAGFDECPELDANLNALADFAEQHIDLEALLTMARCAVAAPSASDSSNVMDPAGATVDSAASDFETEDQYATDPFATTHSAFLQEGTDPLRSPLSMDGKDTFSKEDPHESVFQSETAEVPASNEAPRDDIGSAAVLLAENDPTTKARPASFFTERAVRIGVVHDAAFWFYYWENFDALRRHGADLVRLSLLDNAPWPKVDGLYIGGGMPELHAAALSAQVQTRERVRELSTSGLPIYAECGGFMYLSSGIRLKGREFPMAGVFPCSVEFCERPQGLGYVGAVVMQENAFLPAGARFRGHEFHFSRCVWGGTPPSNTEYILRLDKGMGMAQSESVGEPGAKVQGTGFDGLYTKRTFASYTHLYAPAVPAWAERFIEICRRG